MNAGFPSVHFTVLVGFLDDYGPHPSTATVLALAVKNVGSRPAVSEQG